MWIVSTSTWIWFSRDKAFFHQILLQRLKRVRNRLVQGQIYMAGERTGQPKSKCFYCFILAGCGFALSLRRATLFLLMSSERFSNKHLWKSYSFRTYRYKFNVSLNFNNFTIQNTTILPQSSVFGIARFWIHILVNLLPFALHIVVYNPFSSSVFCSF